MPKNITTIKGPPKTYKTAMLILVANEEAGKGRAVTYLTHDETETTLRSRGLDSRVSVERLYLDDKDRLGKVVSTALAGEEDPRIWRVRQSKKEK
jgi:hypothetical protein